MRSSRTAPLPSDKAPRYLQHIIDNARAVFRYTEGVDLTAFEEDRKTEDRKTYDAVERCLKRITEAVIRLYGCAMTMTASKKTSCSTS